MKLFICETTDNRTLVAQAENKIECYKLMAEKNISIFAIQESSSNIILIFSNILVEELK